MYRIPLLATPAIFLASCATPDESDTPLFVTGDEDELALAESIGVDDADLNFTFSSVTPIRVSIDDLLTAHVRFQQDFEGVPVFGGEAIVHLDPWGEVSSRTDNLLRDVRVDTTPELDGDDAIERAVVATGGWTRTSEEPEAELYVLRRDGDHLAWRVEVRQIEGVDDPASPVVFIDAHDGHVVWSYDNLQTASGTAKYAGSVSVNTTKVFTKYYLEDGTRDIATYTMKNTTSSVSYLTDADNKWTGDSTAVEAHYNAGKVWDYYSTVHGRTGIDGAGGPTYLPSVTGSGAVISEFVHYSKSYVNAFWCGLYMVFGDGDGVTSDPLVSADITGHEFTHGVTQYTAGLIYTGESGGLNEAVSDIFGAMIERYIDGASSTNTWRIGEDVWTPKTSGDALRYMSSPSTDGHSYDYYSSGVGSADVHYSSGIANLAFYLMSEGGTHPRYGGTAVTGIGADKAAAIWYRALTTYMTGSTDFAGARTATLSATADLYGSTSAEYTTVGNAWALVGVGTSTTTTSCTTVTGSVTGTKSWKIEPGGTYFTTTTSGTHSASLTGPSTANYDLWLQSYATGKWAVVAYSSGSSSTESVSYSGAAGSYRWVVYSTSGSGAYSLCYVRPT